MLPLLLMTWLLHPVHETVAEVQWNQGTGRLEVALRLDALDEFWLQRRYGSNPAAPTGDAKKRWEIEYLRSRFRITESPKASQPDASSYHWVGRDEDRGHVWWYFEIEPSDRMPPRWMEQRVLFEKEEDHVNRVVILGQVPKQTMILTMQEPRATFHQAQHDESPSHAEAGR